MPFGKPVVQAGEKEFQSLENRVKFINNLIKGEQEYNLFAFL